ncbi:biotin--protein ligase-like [Acipenser ruthenus]|uniref:biotin--protein ligase-like n=1 Tax=Acipenser ruthenus TaxID=7906 RepID=UPI00274244EB|nr:biotin--protein ligase-like [Acipenser ruthenus]
MLITLCYVYLWVRFQRCYTLVIRSTVHRLHASSSFTFCTALKPGQLQKEKQRHGQSFSKHITRPSNLDETACLQLGNKLLYITDSQPCEDLSKWTLLQETPLIYLESTPRRERVAFVLEAASGQEQKTALHKLSASSKKILKWSDYCLPLACISGDPFKLIASVDNFCRLGVAFMEDRLQMDNGMVPEKIVSVLLEESALKKLVENTKMDGEKSPVPGTQTEQAEAEIPKLKETVSDNESGDNRQDGPQLAKTVQGLQKDRSSDKAQEENANQPQSTDQKENQASLGGNHHRDGHHLHLSSCHECLELENSTIESVKFASAENIHNLPDDYSGFGSEDESCTGQSRRVNVSGKPPNVLVYTGSDPSRFLTKYQQVKTILAECIDMDSYIVYHLLEEQVLKDPWAENSLLLVFASEEPVPEKFHKLFLNYLSKGGKIFGLSSFFCFSGVNLAPKEALKNKIHKLCFTKTDHTDIELDVLTSGMVYEKVGASRDSGVEFWGQLGNKDKDMVIVRLPYGDNGGEAILSQVLLDTSPDSQEIQDPEDFNMLKVSNARRYEVLTEILSALGLSCELSNVPPPSPLYLLTTTESSRLSFLEWLSTAVDTEGILRSAKVSLKAVSALQPGMELMEGILPLVTQPLGFSSEQLDLQTYSRSLQSRSLGQIVLFAEVTPTTMDLLDGMMLQLPQEMGLIAIAGRQTQGKGRGGNAWLSPLGSALFTLHVRVPVQSPLGQRIPFLQHLVALAVVEAVRTLPGYQDIDLRVKWPNDIYYSALMKLGGVLVTSTLMGNTFHALVGCGFNVSNSNPTVCINDLIVQYNKENGSALKALSTAQLIGRSVTVLERLIDAFQEKGAPGVLPLYYKRWVHSGTRVHLWSEQGPQACIVGLDDCGFLQVESEEQGIVSVQHDGNSFDMLRNLIVTKQR